MSAPLSTEQKGHPWEPHDFEAWWREQSRKGDPLHNPNLVRDAFRAGWEAGYTLADTSLPDSIKEALNSGDGVYRP